MTKKKEDKQAKAVQPVVTHDHIPQLTTAVQPTAEADVFSFECTPVAGDWSASGTARRSANGLVISSLEIHASDATQSGVTGNLLRKVPVGEILNHVRADVARLAPPEQVETQQPARAPRRGGRAALSDDLLRQVAVAYLAETRPDRPRAALPRLAAEFGRPEGTIRTWLARAREAGWLGPSVKGRAGAEPGPRLTDLTAAEYTRIYHAETTLEDQVRILAETKRLSLDEAREEFYRRTGIRTPVDPEGEKE